MIIYNISATTFVYIYMYISMNREMDVERRGRESERDGKRELGVVGAQG